ncbi:MAG: hypothetical protein ABTD50_16425 [Polyangiaceae bacterium]|jgi:hypothetical protein
MAFYVGWVLACLSGIAGTRFLTERLLAKRLPRVSRHADKFVFWSVIVLAGLGLREHIGSDQERDEQAQRSQEQATRVGILTEDNRGLSQQLIMLKALGKKRTLIGKTVPSPALMQRMHARAVLPFSVCAEEGDAEAFEFAKSFVIALPSIGWPTLNPGQPPCKEERWKPTDVSVPLRIDSVQTGPEDPALALSDWLTSIGYAPQLHQGASDNFITVGPRDFVSDGR